VLYRLSLDAAVDITLDEALRLSPNEFIWRATLRGGAVMLEQPRVSSDHLPAEQVITMEYVPKQGGLPWIECLIDVDKGERFVRYWTTLWRNVGESQRIYVVGIERHGRHALLGFYPRYRKLVLSDCRPFQPDWEPRPFGNLPKAASLRGGPGTNYLHWTHEGFGGEVQIFPDRMVFRAVYA